MRSGTELGTGGGRRQPASVDFDTIASLDREACTNAWLRQFGHPPPKHISVQFMRKALAYEAQVGAADIRTRSDECFRRP